MGLATVYHNPCEGVLDTQAVRYSLVQETEPEGISGPVSRMYVDRAGPMAARIGGSLIANRRPSESPVPL